MTSKISKRYQTYNHFVINKAETFTCIVFNNYILTLLSFIVHAITQIDTGIEMVRKNQSLVTPSLSNTRNINEIATCNGPVVANKIGAAKNIYYKLSIFKNPCKVTPRNIRVCLRQL